MSHSGLLAVALLREKVSLSSYPSETLGSTTAAGNDYLLILKLLRLSHLIDYGIWLHHPAVALLQLLIKRSSLCQALYTLRLLLFPCLLV